LLSLIKSFNVVSTWYPFLWKVYGRIKKGPKRNVSQKRIRVGRRSRRPLRAAEYLRNELEKKRAPASGRGEGTSANVAREMGGERRAQSREATVSERERERERERKRKVRSSSLNFIPNSRCDLLFLSLPILFLFLLFDIFNLSFYISPSCFLLHSLYTFTATSTFCFSIFFPVLSFVSFSLSCRNITIHSGYYQI